MAADKLKILYVDDEADIRTIVEISLGLDPAMEVKLTASGIEALELIGRGDWMPDIALVDVMMPELNGMDLVKRLHAEPATAKLPVLFVTASARSDEIERYVGAGAIGVISKPFDPLRLAAQVREHLENCAKG